MTIKDLSQLFYLAEEIKLEQETARRLRDAATGTGAKISGLPYSGCVSDKTALGADLAECAQIVQDRADQSVKEYKRIVSYISRVPDSRMRMIIQLRFIEGYSWGKVARKLGGTNTGDGVRKALERYLEGPKK